MAPGEPGFEIDTHRLKIGDGVTQWIDLPYNDNETELNELQQVVNALSSDVTSLGETIETISANAESIGSAIETLGSAVTNIDERVSVVETNLETTNQKLEVVEESLVNNFYTKAETDNIITEIVTDIGHLKRTIVDSLEEIDLDAADANEYIYMVAREDGTYEEYMVIDGKLEKVGDWEVDLSDYAKLTDLAPFLEIEDLADYAKTAEVEEELAKKLDKEEGKSLVSDDLITRLESIEAEAEKNYISAVTSDFDVNNGTLALISIDQSKIIGLKSLTGDNLTLIEALAGKVDKEEGSRLLTNEEADKLTKIIISDDGKVDFSGTINVKNIVGLDVVLEKKVDAIEGMGLSENNFTTELLTKLTNIEAGANVNILEGVSVNGIDLAIIDKKVNIPIASEDVMGVVRSSVAENHITVNGDGTMSVHSLNVNKLTQTEGEWIVLNGGSSSHESN